MVIFYIFCKRLPGRVGVAPHGPARVMGRVVSGQLKSRIPYLDSVCYPVPHINTRLCPPVVFAGL